MLTLLRGALATVRCKAGHTSPRLELELSDLPERDLCQVHASSDGLLEVSKPLRSNGRGCPPGEVLVLDGAKGVWFWLSPHNRLSLGVLRIEATIDGALTPLGLSREVKF